MFSHVLICEYMCFCFEARFEKVKNVITSVKTSKQRHFWTKAIAQTWKYYYLITYFPRLSSSAPLGRGLTFRHGSPSSSIQRVLLWHSDQSHILFHSPCPGPSRSSRSPPTIHFQISYSSHSIIPISIVSSKKDIVFCQNFFGNFVHV